MFDDFTPVELWREYGDRKRQLHAAGIPHGAEWNARINEIVDELGLGVPPDELTDEQLETRAKVIARWQI